MLNRHTTCSECGASIKSEWGQKIGLCYCCFSDEDLSIS